ncbi:hypothetical protein SO694_00017489 [Aureococcus anophagefferens]|uniref:Uncharacterized protein n=1 Tax=Aureococcus anophagefferens TaxID=44056 RepID=A0ABR1G2B4_AURAN
MHVIIRATVLSCAFTFATGAGASSWTRSRPRSPASKAGLVEESALVKELPPMVSSVVHAFVATELSKLERESSKLDGIVAGKHSKLDGIVAGEHSKPDGIVAGKHSKLDGNVAERSAFDGNVVAERSKLDGIVAGEHSKPDGKHVAGEHSNRTSALFFAHIPKTAGTSATRWLQDAARRASMMFGHGEGDYHCYNPHNMLARALTCDDPRLATDSRCASCCADAGDRRATCSHHAADRDALIPDATAAVRAVRFDLGFIGVTELFTESLCLLGFLLDGALPGKSCVDGGDSPIVPPDDRGFELHHEAHGVPPHDVRAVPRATLDVVDAYTAVDREVYRAAFTRLVADLRALERRAGVRVLSPERLADAKAAVGYVWAVDGFEQG